MFKNLEALKFLKFYFLKEHIRKKKKIETRHCDILNILAKKYRIKKLKHSKIFEISCL